MIMEYLSGARLKRKRVNNVDYNRARLVIAQVKDMMRIERDVTIKKILAAAGMELNKLLMK